MTSADVRLRAADKEVLLNIANLFSSAFLCEPPFNRARGVHQQWRTFEIFQHMTKSEQQEFLEAEKQIKLHSSIFFSVSDEQCDAIYRFRGRVDRIFDKYVSVVRPLWMDKYGGVNDKTQPRFSIARAVDKAIRRKDLKWTESKDSCFSMRIYTEGICPGLERQIDFQLMKIDQLYLTPQYSLNLDKNLGDTRYTLTTLNLLGKIMKDDWLYPVRTGKDVEAGTGLALDMILLLHPIIDEAIVGPLRRWNIME